MLHFGLFAFLSPCTAEIAIPLSCISGYARMVTQVRKIMQRVPQNTFKEAYLFLSFIGVPLPSLKIDRGYKRSRQKRRATPPQDPSNKLPSQRSAGSSMEMCSNNLNFCRYPLRPSFLPTSLLLQIHGSPPQKKSSTSPLGLGKHPEIPQASK